jgi:putative transposase
MDWKHLLAYISGSVEEELLLRMEYLVAENRILRDQITGRLRLTDAERKRHIFTKNVLTRASGT